MTVILSDREKQHSAEKQSAVFAARRGIRQRRNDKSLRNFILGPLYFVVIRWIQNLLDSAEDPPYP